MKITEEVQTVLAIVRRVLNSRTNWVNQGQDLMTEIEMEVKKAPEVKKA